MEGPRTSEPGTDFLDTKAPSAYAVPRGPQKVPRYQESYRGVVWLVALVRRLVCSGNRLVRLEGVLVLSSSSLEALVTLVTA